MPPTNAWVIAPARKTLVVGVAEMAVCNDSNAEIVTYSLGSCLGITIYDALKKIGGLLHIMLPDSRISPARAMDTPYMFVDTGLPLFFQAACQLGAARSRLDITVAGGAHLLDQQGLFNIGARNFDALQKLLAQNGLNIRAADVGGLSCRTVRLDLANGNVTVKTPGATPCLL